MSALDCLLKQCINAHLMHNRRVQRPKASEFAAVRPRFRASSSVTTTVEQASDCRLSTAAAAATAAEEDHEDEEGGGVLPSITTAGRVTLAVWRPEAAAATSRDQRSNRRKGRIISELSKGSTSI